LGAAWQHIQLLDSGCSEETALAAKDLGAHVFNLLQFHGRSAEAFETAQALSRRAWLDGDRPALERWEREKGWILHNWGSAAGPPVRLGGFHSLQQLTLGFESCLDLAATEF
jgi:hypothetical protein